MTEKDWKGFIVIQANPSSVQGHPWTEFDESNFGVSNLQKIVGGYIEMVQTKFPGIHMYCNEEGKLRQLPINRLATYLLPEHSDDVIVGDVVVLRDGKGGDEAPLDANDLYRVLKSVGLDAAATI
jgi:hypothetical protein